MNSERNRYLAPIVGHHERNAANWNPWPVASEWGRAIVSSQCSFAELKFFLPGLSVLFVLFRSKICGRVDQLGLTNKAKKERRWMALRHDTTLATQLLPPIFAAIR